MAEKLVSSRISRDIVALLKQRGMSLTAIAASLKVTKSYISRVNAGTRSLTLDHLSELERLTGEPVPLLLMQAIPRDTVSPAMLPAYDATLNLLTGKTAARLKFASKPSPKRRSRTKAA